MDEYQAPRMNKKVRLRNPKQRPLPLLQDSYGNVTEVEWGEIVWAHRRDISVTEQAEDGVPTRVIQSQFTVRSGPRIDPDVEIVDGDQVFVAVGPPLDRGTRGNGFSHALVICRARA
ncbi:MAG: head-tail adaptor protein [Spirochaetaceae bacterium]|nr:head-tail adaptor protein [Spirochaetaceae bacterium]